MTPATQHSDDPTTCLVTTAELHALELSKQAIARLCAHGNLTRVARGIYSTDPAFNPREAHRHVVNALVNSLPVQARAEAVVSHGQRQHCTVCGCRHVTSTGSGSPDRAPVVAMTGNRCTPSGLPPPHEEVVTVDGLPVTSMARTAVDIARNAGFAEGLAVVDHALWLGTSRRDVRASVTRGLRRPGNNAARRAVAAGNARAGSLIESLLRATMIDAPLPRPLVHSEVTDRHSNELATVPFL
ncbi:type IV toxin-antitoxin system AbiEi family antitoxin domain-containing protein [Luteococcus sp. H138]|uniref:type IV toxin-antitoxin system AbiEi family antitoxin domain-containing protein n=1 Tax=unclassified Luteococcus TaxID=2639923 RepID=UPI00313D5389